MPRKPIALTCLTLLALSACGTRTTLRPATGHELPGAPYGRVDRPAAPELLVNTPQSRPGLNIELLQRSQERPDDAFDLPPPSK